MLLRKYVPYTTYLLENLINKKIACVSPSRFNDPLDSYFLKNENIIKEFEDIKPKNIRVTCLNYVDKYSDTILSNEMLMWAHYANSHKGLCIEYEINESDFSNLKSYGNNWEKMIFFDKITYMDDFLKHIKKVHLFNNNDISQKLCTLFYTKDKAFEYEKEYRILKYSISDKDNIDFIDSPNINKIIFGYRCEDNIKNVIININDSIYSKRIKLYRVNENFEEVLL